MALLLLLLLVVVAVCKTTSSGSSACDADATSTVVDVELRSWLDDRGYSSAAPALEARDGGLFVRDGHRVSPGDVIATIPPSLMVSANTVFGGSTELPDHVRSLTRSNLGGPSEAVSLADVVRIDVGCTGGSANVALPSTLRSWFAVGVLSTRDAEYV